MELLHSATTQRGNVAARAPLTADLLRRAGEGALEIARIAGRHAQLGTLAAALTEYLAQALEVNAAALFWRHACERDGKERPFLRAIATASASERSDVAAAQPLKWAAYRALAAAGASLRTAPIHALAGDNQVRHMLALPIGEPLPWAVLAVTWLARRDAETTWRSELAALYAPSLALATRPLHALDEAARDDSDGMPRRAEFALTSEAIVSIGQDLTIVEINPAFGRLMGWPEGQAAGRRCFEVLRCRDTRKELLCGTPRCPAHQAFVAEVELPLSELAWTTRDGKVCELSASISVERGPQPTRAVLVARDVTALNAANRMRSNFISMVSHELRTPLNTINGFLEIVTEGQVGPLNERQREFLNYARVSTQQLTTLVEDILFISKADSGQFKLRLAAVELPKVVEQAVQGQSAAAEKSEVRIVVELPDDLPELLADELRLLQVLNNLLGNAVKFSPPRGTVVLRVRADGPHLSFAVTDQGKGVAPEDHARIFDRFYQSEATVRARTGGYGLGLAIAKLIVEQHGGRIWIESEPGNGATFRFTLPTGHAQAE